MSEHSDFLKAFFRSASNVGAIAPSSNRLACLMTDWFDWNEVDNVLEFGPGTGVVTEVIQSRKKDDTFFMAIERDPELAAISRQRCPGVNITQDCVTKVAELCEKEGVSSVEVILSGLPWASFPKELQDRCLEAMFSVLPPGGRFATFAYLQGLMLPAGKRFRKLLDEHFSSVEISPTAWKNLPPAFVYRCVR